MLISKYKEIENLRMTEIKGNRPANAEKVIVIGSMIVVRLANGKWWCNWPRFNSFARMPGLWRGQASSLLNGLAALGLIPKSVVDEHLARCQQIEDADHRKYDQQELERISKEYGVKVPNLTNKRIVRENKK